VTDPLELDIETGTEDTTWPGSPQNTTGEGLAVRVTLWA
jgi:hypothetical protein